MMEKPASRLVPTQVVLSLYTSHLLCEFGDMHAFAEFLCGMSIWTHMFAHRPFIAEMQRALLKQQPLLQGSDASAVTTENWEAFRDAEVARLGPQLRIHPMGEPEHCAEAFNDPLAGKATIFVEVSSQDAPVGVKH